MSEGKVMTSFTEAVADVVDGSVLIVGGFGLSGCPEHSIAALRQLGPTDLVIVSNNCGVDDFGLGVLLENRQIRGGGGGGGGVESPCAGVDALADGACSTSRSIRFS